MAVHHGGKVGGAAKKLASKSTSKSTKSKAERHWRITRRSVTEKIVCNYRPEHVLKRLFF